jgi:rod shape-determining protein MreD
VIWPQTLARGAVLIVGALLVVTLSARGFHPVPDLVAIPVAAVALRGGPRAGLAAGLVGGWALDLLPPGSALLGLSAMAYAVAGVVVGRSARRGWVPWLVVALQVLLATVIVDAVSIVVALLRDGQVDLVGLGWRWLVTLTVGLVLGPVLMRADARLTGQSARARVSHLGVGR